MLSILGLAFITMSQSKILSKMDCLEVSKTFGHGPYFILFLGVYNSDVISILWKNLNKMSVNETVL